MFKFLYFIFYGQRDLIIGKQVRCHRLNQSYCHCSNWICVYLVVTVIFTVIINHFHSFDFGFLTWKPSYDILTCNPKVTDLVVVVIESKTCIIAQVLNCNHENPFTLLYRLIILSMFYPTLAGAPVQWLHTTPRQGCGSTVFDVSLRGPQKNTR